MPEFGLAERRVLAQHCPLECRGEHPIGVGLEAGECGQDQRGTTFIGRTVVVAVRRAQNEVVVEQELVAGRGQELRSRRADPDALRRCS